MLKRLRWQLSLLYTLAALALIVLIGGGAYRLLAYYFQYSTDLALQYKVVLEYTKLGVMTPSELEQAGVEWLASRNHAASASIALPKSGAELEAEGGSEGSNIQETESDDPYDSELSSIYVLAADSQGRQVINPSTPASPLKLDEQAVAAAMANGHDLRTVRLVDGTRLRLLSYRIGSASNQGVVQVGRSLADQDYILSQLLIGLLILGGFSVVFVGLGSWWLAGRSLKPAQQAWDKQQTFVANASHELRTPLTLLRASAEVTQRGLADEDKNREFLDDILQETDHMSHLVDDLLLLSRLDADRLPLERQAIAIPELIDELGRKMGRVAQEREVQLEAGPADGVVYADLPRLRQVLLILLDNALLHTPAGGKVRLEAHPNGRSVLVSVTDNGGGISPEHLPHLFERFYRGVAGRRQSDGGSGLGLAIAKALVEAQHGRIHLTSQPGQGTCVTVDLPAK
jgi:signal transduction histidine kinase